MKLCEVTRVIPKAKNLVVLKSDFLDLTSLEDADEDMLAEVICCRREFNELRLTFNKVELFAGSGNTVMRILERYAENVDRDSNNELYGAYPKSWTGEDLSIAEVWYNFKSKTISACFKITINVWGVAYRGEKQPKHSTPVAFKHPGKVEMITNYRTVSVVPSNRALRMIPSHQKGEQKTPVGDLDLMYLKAQLKKKGYFF